MIAVERMRNLKLEMETHAADARAQGLEGTKLVEYVVERVGLEAVTCPPCRGRGCKLCSGDGWVFRLRERAEA